MNLVIAAIIVVLLVCAFRLYRLATRLDRLHRRTEAAWAALDVALARRSGVARALAAAGDLAPAVATTLAAAARRTEDAGDRTRRADAENELTRLLEQLPTPPDSSVADELAETAQRVLLARRFYNDAVRDTRALRADRFSRMFRLAGRASLPDYFEIAEYNPSRPLNRVSARVLMIDDADRVLLFQGGDPQLPGDRFWFTPGGGVEAGEDLLGAAQRELTEETRMRLPRTAFAGPVWWRRSRFTFSGQDYEQTEYFFVAAPPADAAVHHDGFTEVERSYIHGEEWWAADALAATGDVVYPLQLTARLPEAVKLLREVTGGRGPAVPPEPTQID
ncbi:NUDIX hydrolase [Nakamurella deserti]|uniref:NUDIX hydrolase n=1 Tax=Nakamurella deserti TaxID=2164074 RepID=UPI000DBE695B|nr:NUDIX domain-containing protein [Nakamurella deserti]